MTLVSWLPIVRGMITQNKIYARVVTGERRAEVNGQSRFVIVLWFSIYLYVLTGRFRGGEEKKQSRRSPLTDWVSTNFWSCKESLHSHDKQKTTVLLSRSLLWYNIQVLLFICLYIFSHREQLFNNFVCYN